LADGSEPAGSDDTQSADQQRVAQVDEIASKYFAVWVWSIVIGISTTTAYSLNNFYPRSRGSFLIFLLEPLLILSAIFCILSWYRIIVILERCIIPAFFGRAELVGTEKDRHLLARDLSLAVRFSFISLIFRLLLSVADLALNTFSL
jgi:hypothetical protein